MGRFRSPTHIVDDRQIFGTLFDQVDGIMGWFRERLQTEFVISGKAQRDVIWEYPLDAIREGIVNAICHRNYSDRSCIEIRLYDQRLEIWNPGGLSPSLALADLLKTHRSIRRNSLIAEAFFLTGFIESWGTGTIRMADILRTSKLPAPVFETPDPESFRLVFVREELSLESLRELGLTERQIEGVLLCKKEGQLTNLQYQEQFGIAKRTASLELKVLVDRGILVKHGRTGKGTFYVLKTKG